MSGGGTAGHIYPALALAAELRSRGHTLSYVGTPDGPEARLAPAAGLDFIAAPASGFDRARPLTLLTSSLLVLRSAAKLRRTFKQWRPDVVVGFGGYVAIPVGLAARFQIKRIPIVVHEQNSVPGMTNRFLARYASIVAVTYPQTAALFREQRAKSDPSEKPLKVVVTGDPVRSEVLAAEGERGRKRLGINGDALVLLVFGGSRGARHLNEALLRVLPELLARYPQLQVIHASGAGEYEQVRAAAEELTKHGDFDGKALSARYKLFPYLDDIADILAAADLAVTRAGATSIAELTALGVPAVLVPFPRATDDHQTTNARDLVAAGGALALPDTELDSADFMATLDELLSDGKRRDTMAKASRRFGRPDAATLLANCVEAAALTEQKDVDYGSTGTT